MLTLLVGSHFHPPAKEVLQFLPAGASLELRPEPDNPYDPLAVQVGIDPSGRDWPMAMLEALEGYGVDPVEWSERDWCCLGHLAKTGGKPLEKHPELSGNAEAHQSADACPDGWPGLKARLGFLPEGKPTVEWDHPAGDVRAERTTNASS